MKPTSALNHQHKACCFCGTPFYLSRRSVEHVIPRWLLDRLGIGVSEKHRSTETNHDGEIVDEHSMGAHSRKFNRVCQTCNSGWLSALEAAVQPIFEKLLTECEGTLTFEECLVLSSWMYKTSALFFLTLANRKHLIREDDLRYFYKNRIPRHSGYLHLFNLRAHSQQQLSTFAPRMRYGFHRDLTQNDVRPLQMCYVLYLQLGDILFRYAYVNPSHYWNFAGEMRIQGGQMIWPAWQQVRWSIDAVRMKEPQKRDYVVSFLLNDEGLRYLHEQKNSPPSKSGPLHSTDD